MKRLNFMLALGAICIGGFLASCERSTTCTPKDPAKKGGSAIITIEEVDAETGVVTRSYNALERNVTWSGEGGDVEISGERTKSFDGQPSVSFELDLSGRENVVYKGWTVSYPEDEVPYKSVKNPMVQNATGLHSLEKASFNVANRHPGDDTHVTFHVEYKKYSDDIYIPSFPVYRWGWSVEDLKILDQEIREMRSRPMYMDQNTRNEAIQITQSLRNDIALIVEGYQTLKDHYIHSLMDGNLPKTTPPYDAQDEYGTLYYKLVDIRNNVIGSDTAKRLLNLGKVGHNWSLFKYFEYIKTTTTPNPEDPHSIGGYYYPSSAFLHFLSTLEETSKGVLLMGYAEK